jgi:hypothetical protein
MRNVRAYTYVGLHLNNINFIQRTTEIISFFLISISIVPISIVMCLATETRSSDYWLVLFQSSPVVTTRNYYTFKTAVIITHKVFYFTHYIFTGKPLVFFCWPAGSLWYSLGNCQPLTASVKSKLKSHCDWRPASQSVLVSSPHLGLMTRYLLLLDSYSLVVVGRPHWREDGSVFCQSHCLH